jgi:hypothetical protein
VQRDYTVRRRIWRRKSKVLGPPKMWFSDGIASEKYFEEEKK